ncbi:MAG: hypothetical protein V2B20_15000 [Pseudomonadota bacterium]
MSEIKLQSKYFYRAFGLILCSDLAIPELQSTVEQKADVTISIAPLSAKFHGGDNKEFHFSSGFNYFYLQLKNVAKYLITNGCQITIDPISGTTAGQMRLYLLGTSMGVLLHQRGNLPLHGSGIATPNGCALFLGESGIGKSTMAAALSKYGFRIITDDICALSFNNPHDIEVLPSYPQLKLSRDSAKYLQIALTNLTQISSDLEKYGVQVSDFFQRTPLQIASIFILSYHDDSDIKIKQIKGVQKFIELSNNIYRGNLVEKLQLTEQQFRLCSQLCQNTVSVFQIQRPKNTFSLIEITNLLLKYISG